MQVTPGAVEMLRTESASAAPLSKKVNEPYRTRKVESRRRMGALGIHLVPETAGGASDRARSHALTIAQPTVGERDSRSGLLVRYRWRGSIVSFGAQTNRSRRRNTYPSERSPTGNVCRIAKC